MSRLTRYAAILLLLGVGLAASPLPGTSSGAQSNSVLQGRVVTVTVEGIANQLGVRLSTGGNDEFALGRSFTGVLSDPQKLATLGIKNMHVGARVTAMRIATDKVYVEADELEPPSRASVKLMLDADGALVPPKN